MINRAFTKNIISSRIIALLLLLVAVIILGGFVLLIQYSPLFLLLFFIIIPVTQFFISPFFRVVGYYNYLSPMLLAIAQGTKRYDIHNGTSFDYLLHMRKINCGTPWQNRLLYFYLTGLLEVIRRVENDEIPEEIIIRGSSYFFSENTALRLGFRLEKPPVMVYYKIITDYIDLTWMYSCSKRRLAFPSLKNVKAAVTTGRELCLHKAQLIILQKKLSSYGT